jgi:catechol 2,3-dioxygenase-like lactoylglutathione lyase family enzyme
MSDQDTLTHPTVQSTRSKRMRMPQRLHHNAYVCKDGEATRRFYEDMLGMPLVASFSEDGEIPEFPGRKINWLHLFFGLEDQGALAFFQFSDEDVYDVMKPKVQNDFHHIALVVDTATQEELKRRLMEARLHFMVVNHNFIRSVYTRDPDGMLVEYSVITDQAAEIDAVQRRTAHQTLKRWLAGDKDVNNVIQSFERY